MGNTESTPATPQSFSVIKPSTNSSSPSNPSSPAQTGDRASHATPTEELSEIFSEIVTASGNGDLRSQQDAKQRLRIHLFGLEGSSHQHSDGDVSETSTPTITPTKDSVLRSDSVLSQLSSPRGSSTLLSSVSDSRLSLVLQRTEERRPSLTQRDGPYLSQQSSTISDLQSSEKSTTSTRRRSLFTPTMTSKARAKKTLSKPRPPEHLQSQADRDYYYNPDCPEFSPLSRLAALDLVECLTQGPPRSSTPCDLDYSHLTGLKRGTLRITNGAASPDPSLKTIRNLSEVVPSDLKYDLDTVTSEHDGNPELDERSDRQTPSEASSRANKVLTSIDTNACRSRAPPKVPPKDQQQATNDEEHLGPQLSEKGSVESIYATPLQSPDKAAVIAREYMDELPSSPYGVTTANDARPTSPKIGDDPPRIVVQGRSRDGDTSPEGHAAADLLQAPVTEYRLPSRKEATDHRTPPPLVIPLPSGSMQTAHKTLKKSDSGYSSNLSICSREDTVPRNDLLEQDEDCCEDENVRYSHDSGLPIIDPQIPLKVGPPVPPKSPPRKSSRRRVKSDAEPARKDKPLPAEKAPPRPPPKPAGLKCPPRNAGASEKTTKPTVQAQPASAPRKLQKQRRLSMPVLTMQKHPDIGRQDIPSPSVEIVSRHAERLKSFPALDHTFPDLDTTTYRERCESPQSVLTHVSFPNPRREPTERASTTLGHRVSHGVSPRPFPAPSRITTFGTVTSSLGSGPYDAALPTPSPSRGRIPSKRHPHQIGGAMESRRSHTMIGMDAEAAALYARERSYDVGKFWGTHGVPGYSRPLSMREDRMQEPQVPTMLNQDAQSSRERIMRYSVPFAGRPNDVRRSESVKHPLCLRPGPRHSSTAPVPTIQMYGERAGNDYIDDYAGCYRASNNRAAEMCWDTHKSAWKQRRASAGERLAKSWDVKPRNG
ncbi:MAG: hypothetical protein M1833_005854 [Piccolia ochrophora]|nr:MAG: hypothetical protein M1833_005854 [Piccolia ochrophora]